MKKRVKNVFVVIGCLVLAGAVLAGCGASRQSGQDAQTDGSVSAVEETEQEPAAEQEAVNEEEQGEAEKAEEPESAEETDTTEDTNQAEETVQESGGYEDNFAVDSEAAKEFAMKVKEAAAQKDLEALAELTAFPVYVGLPDVGVVETKEAFLALGAEAVFTEGLLESVEKADIEDFQPSMAGFSISDGGTANINFGVAEGVLAINGINY